MAVVVAGGSGFLGGELVRRWRAEGKKVQVLTRRPRHADDVPWAPHSGDMSWSPVLDGADAVVNLAGEGIADQRWSAGRRLAILESRVTATRALVTGIQAAARPPTVFISSSAIGIYGTARGDDPVTEATPAGSDFLADVCRAWEAEASRAEGITRVVLLRTGVVLARDGGALPQMALPFRFFAGGPIGSGRQFVSWIHRQDWVAMTQWALRTPEVSGPLNATAPSPVTNAEFARTLGRALHRPSFVPTPAFALRLAFGEMADALLLGGQRVLPAHAQRLGFDFTYPTLEPALREIYR